MKKILTLCLCALLLTSCHKAIWEMLNDHEARIARLEALCNQYNTTIASLQQLVMAMQAEARIQDIVPVMEDGETIGYTITFVNGEPITIYNGKNGQDGKDGHTPIIGVKQDSDGIWYWTLDDDWMLNDNGEKIRSDALQALIPRLKVDEEFWWVSYDDGATWHKLGKAVGEGDTAMFSEITQDDDYVYFVLTNGQTITLPKGNRLTWVYV